MKKTILTQEDIDLFRQHVENTQPLPPTNTVTKKITPKIIKEIEPLSDHYHDPVFAETKLSFARGGLQHKLLRQLRQGQLAQTAILDLHGKIVEESRHSIQQFLQQAVKRNCRVVRIIHGKGAHSKQAEPLLKNLVNTWLKQHPAVLAFCSAQPKDGGEGAVYVLLKRE